MSTEENSFVQTKTENGLLIEVANSFSVECSRETCPQKITDSGSFTMINSCTLPITVTGIKVSDAVRFSLFKFPDYTGVEIYSSGNVNELPFTLNPREKIKVNTYFHPLYEELKYGNAGTPENRTGDQFGAEVRMLPGFPIINCNKAPCDASFILTGEFLCENEEHDLEWLKNLDNINNDFKFEDLQSYQMPELTNASFLIKKPSVIKNIASNSASNAYDGLLEAAEQYIFDLEAIKWYSRYQDYGIVASLRAFTDLVQNVNPEKASYTVNNNAGNGGIKIEAATAGSQGNNINIKLTYSEASNTSSESANSIIIKRSSTTPENAQTIIDEINLLNLATASLEGVDGPISSFDISLEGGIDSRKNDINNLTNLDFEKTYVQLDYRYNDMISFKSSYTANTNTTAQYNGQTYNVINFSNQSVDNNPDPNIYGVPFISNQSMFYKINSNSVEIFLCDEGDFENETILEG